MAGSKSDRSADPAHLRLLLWRAAKAMEAVDAASIGATGLGRTDFAILEVLLHKGKLPVNAIGAKVLLTSGSITTAIDRLEQKKLVRRSAHPGDRRVRLVGLTRNGRTVIEKAFAAHHANLERVASGLTRAQRRKFAALLKQLGKQARTVAGDVPGR